MMRHARLAVVATLSGLVLGLGFDGTAARAVPAVTITEFSAGIPAAANPAGIVTGPDGNLWFTEDETNQVARITPRGVVTQFPGGGPPGSGPANIAVGPDGNVWFTDIAAAIGRITPAGVVTTFTTGITQGTDAIVAGSDGNMWFTEFHNMIGKITPNGVVTEYTGANGETNSITAGPDGNLWYATLDHSIGRTTTSGVITSFTAGIDPNWGTSRITAGPDGALWFTIDSGGIGRISTAGMVTEFSAGLAGTEPLGITTGPDGALWFTDFAQNRIGRITTSGAVSLYSAGISAGAGPQAITTGPDGNLWFTEALGHRVGKVVINGATDTGPPLPPFTRISGADRIATAVAVSAREYPAAKSAQGVVLARADTFPDALAGGPLAASLHAPLLLTSATSLNAATESQIKTSLAPGGTVTLLGGTNAISDAVCSSHHHRRIHREALHRHRPRRHSDLDRRRQPNARSDPARRRRGFADALSAGAAAAHLGGVVLLTDGITLTAAVRTYIAAHPGVPVYAVGGPAAAAYPTATPLVGADRYATSVAVAHKFVQRAHYRRTVQRHHIPRCARRRRRNGHPRRTDAARRTDRDAHRRTHLHHHDPHHHLDERVRRPSRRREHCGDHGQPALAPPLCDKPDCCREHAAESSPADDRSARTGATLRDVVGGNTGCSGWIDVRPEVALAGDNCDNLSAAGRVCRRDETGTAVMPSGTSHGGESTVPWSRLGMDGGCDASFGIGCLHGRRVGRRVAGHGRRTCRAGRGCGGDVDQCDAVPDAAAWGEFVVGV